MSIIFSDSQSSCHYYKLRILKKWKVSQFVANILISDFWTLLTSSNFSNIIEIQLSCTNFVWLNRWLGAQAWEWGSIPKWRHNFVLSPLFLEGLVTSKANSLFPPLQKPLRARKYQLKKLSLECTFLFWVLTENSKDLLPSLP